MHRIHSNLEAYLNSKTGLAAEHMLGQQRERENSTTTLLPYKRRVFKSSSKLVIGKKE